MAQPQNFTCEKLQAGLRCSYGCTPDRILCHAFFDDTCTVCEARYCHSGWHERVEYDTKLQYEAKRRSTEETKRERQQIRLRSVAQCRRSMKKPRSEESPRRKLTKRPRSEEARRSLEEDTDTDTDIMTNISLCKLGVFDGMPHAELLDTAYTKKMHEAQGNKREKAAITKAYFCVHSRLQRRRDLPLHEA